MSALIGEGDPPGSQQGGVFVQDHVGGDGRHIVLEPALAFESLAERTGLQERQDARGDTAGDMSPATAPSMAQNRASVAPQGLW